MLALIALRRNDPPIGFLAGVAIGLATFTKNEGIMIAAIISPLFCAYAGVKNRATTPLRLSATFLAGLLLTGSCTLILKCFFSAPNNDILPVLTTKSVWGLDLTRLTTVISAFFKEAFGRRWGYVGILILITFMTTIRRFFRQECVPIVFFFMLYALSLVGIYTFVSTIDIHWWLDTSLYRLYYQILPALIFFCIYAVARPSDDQHAAVNTTPPLFRRSITATRAGFKHREDLLCAGIVTALFIYTCLRALNISISHDEAITSFYVLPHSFLEIITYHVPFPSNNHLLHTLLTKIFVLFFGLNEFVVRAPALIGHVLYLTGAYLLTRKIFTKLPRILALCLLTTNPYLLDFFSCSRGYSLSIGFLMLGLYAVLVGSETTADRAAYQKNVRFACICFSGMILAHIALLQLFVALVAIGLGYECMRLIFARKATPSPTDTARPPWWTTPATILTACVLMAAVYINPIKLMLELKEFYYGGDTGFWHDSVRSLIQGTLYERYTTVPAVSFGIQLMICAVLIFAAGILLYQKTTRRAYTATHTHIAIALILPVASFGIIMLQRALFQTKFITGRTALYFIPIFFFLLLSLWRWGLGSERKRTRVITHTITATITGLAIVHFFLCLNLTHFYEWKYDASTKKMMRAVMTLNASEKLPPNSRSMGVNWVLEPSINFYRTQYQLTWLKKVERAHLFAKHDYYYFSKDTALIGNKEVLLNILFYTKTGLTTLREYPLSDTLLATRPQTCP